VAQLATKILIFQLLLADHVYIYTNTLVIHSLQIVEHTIFHTQNNPLNIHLHVEGVSYDLGSLIYNS